MEKLEAFKEFAKNHSELVNYLKEHPDMNWQKFYEIYDIYGSDERSWAPYLTSTSSSNNINTSFKSIGDIVKNIDVNSIQEHIKSAQKALGVIEELTAKGTSKIASIKGPTTPRPITKFFGD